jgi:hypothetical protein
VGALDLDLDLDLELEYTVLVPAWRRVGGGGSGRAAFVCFREQPVSDSRLR